MRPESRRQRDAQCRSEVRKSTHRLRPPPVSCSWLIALRQVIEQVYRSPSRPQARWLVVREPGTSSVCAVSARECRIRFGRCSRGCRIFYYRNRARIPIVPEPAMFQRPKAIPSESRASRLLTLDDTQTHHLPSSLLLAPSFPRTPAGRARMDEYVLGAVDIGDSGAVHPGKQWAGGRRSATAIKS